MARIPRSPLVFRKFGGRRTIPKVGNTPGTEDFSPYLLLNMDTQIDGRLEKRDGYEKAVNLQDAHSLFADGAYLFCIGKGTGSPESLWRIDATHGAVEVSAIRGKGFPMGYVSVNEKIYLSSKAWNGIYDSATATVGAWGSDQTDDLSGLADMATSEEAFPLHVRKAPYMENLCQHGGRIFGSTGKHLVFSDPFAFEWFRDENFLPFPEEILMVASTPVGLYVGATHTTWFLRGTNPGEMALSRVGTGVLAGSLQYGSFEKFGQDIPLWVSKEGIMAGVEGAVVPLTANKVRFDISGRAASAFRFRNGEPQYLAGFPLPEASLGDAVTADVVRNGKLI